MTHPVLMAMIAQERQADTLRYAHRYRIDHVDYVDHVDDWIRSRQPITGRQRIGWLLVSVGLRLAVGNG